jgi:hypothetical protein
MVFAPHRGRRNAYRYADVLDDIDAIKRFAGDDFTLAKYYDFDSEYLIEKEAGVRHYEVSSQVSPAPFNWTATAQSLCR